LTENQESDGRKLAAVYVDGFNLYHPLHEMNEPFLKWCDVWALSEAMVRPHDLKLVKVTFCTAVPDHLPASRDRHNTYNNALAAKGVTVVKGHHVYDQSAGKYSEKQSDINVALSLMLDGIDDVYDWAFLVSADSDQAATAKCFSERLPGKKLVSVAPPNRSVPSKCIPFSHKHFSISKHMVEAAVMEGFVQTPRNTLIRRPTEYDPPLGWVHPRDRPAKKKPNL
jgi:NYN domain